MSDETMEDAPSPSGVKRHAFIPQSGLLARLLRRAFTPPQGGIG